MKVDEQKEEMHSLVYDLPLLNEKGEVVMFQVYVIDRIFTNVRQINLTEAIVSRLERKGSQEASWRNRCFDRF